jgi:hypothetical protein
MTRPLTTEQLRDELLAISYRKGWRLNVYDDPFEGQKLRVVAPELPDSYDPDGTRTIDVGADTFIPPMLTAEQFHWFIWWRLDRIERHEAREFLRVNGEVLFDPHATD